LALHAAIQARASATLGGTSELAAAVTTRRREGCAARELTGAQADCALRSDRVLACAGSRREGWCEGWEPCGSCLVAMHGQQARGGRAVGMDAAEQTERRGSSRQGDAGAWRDSPWCFRSFSGQEEAPCSSAEGRERRKTKGVQLAL
jgi:hypothetical protein